MSTAQARLGKQDADPRAYAYGLEVFEGTRRLGG